MRAHQSVQEAKLYVLKGKFSEFTMKKDESVAEMFNRLNDIVNELKGLGFEVPDADFSHRFLKSLPERASSTLLSDLAPSELIIELVSPSSLLTPKGMQFR